MDNLKYVTKLAEALHDFAFKLEANADLFTKEDSTITISFNRLYHPSQLIELLDNQLKEDSSVFSINHTTQTPTVALVQTEEQTPTNSNPLANCTLEDFNSTKKVLKAAKEINRTDGPFLDSINKILNTELPLLLKELTKQFKEEQEAQLKHKFNNLLKNASISDFKRLHRILDLVEVHIYSICKHPLDQHIWYNKNKIEELYQEQTKTTTDIL